MKILRAYGIPDKLVQLIECSYRDILAQIKTEDGLSGVIQILAGVLQGDTLAPYLFIIVIDYVMRETLAGRDVGFTLRRRLSSRYPEVKISDTGYADDLSLISDTVVQAQEFLESLEKSAAAVGLYLNEDKTKFMSSGLDAPIITSASGLSLEHVQDFVYLGSHLKSSEYDFNIRKAKAWAACHKMKSIWNTDLRRDIKIRLFRATVEAILLYGSETWTVTSSLAKRLDGCYSRMLRMALGVCWWEKLSNAEVFKELLPASVVTQQRRMRLSGHIHRHSDLSAHHLLLWEPDRGTRNRGRPRMTFLDLLKKDTGLDNTREIGRLMTDRDLWRSNIYARTLKPT